MPSACKQSCNCTHVYGFHKAITRIYRARDCGAASWAADKTKDCEMKSNRPETNVPVCQRRTEGKGRVVRLHQAPRKIKNVKRTCKKPKNGRLQKNLEETKKNCTCKILKITREKKTKKITQKKYIT